MKPLPARLTKEQVAELLGCKPHDVPVLVRFGLLKPLGKPTQQCVKYFAAVDIDAKSQDVKWLGRATDALYQNWRNEGEKVEGQPK